MLDQRPQSINPQRLFRRRITPECSALRFRSGRGSKGAFACRLLFRRHVSSKWMDIGYGKSGSGFSRGRRWPIFFRTFSKQ